MPPLVATCTVPYFYCNNICQHECPIALFTPRTSNKRFPYGNLHILSYNEEGFLKTSVLSEETYPKRRIKILFPYAGHMTKNLGL